jgi:hypothetical protein
MRLAVSVARPNLVSLGTCFGKFSKTGKFRLHITALDYLVQYAKHKVWIKPNGELPFLYGNHVVKAHLGRISDDTPEHAGVVVLSMSGTGLVSDSSEACGGGRWTAAGCGGCSGVREARLVSSGSRRVSGQVRLACGKLVEASVWKGEEQCGSRIVRSGQALLQPQRRAALSLLAGGPIFAAAFSPAPVHVDADALLRASA